MNKSFKRHEKKFLLNEKQYYAVLPVLRQHMELDEYCREGQEYSIYNIYYDTDHAGIIRHSLSQPYYKEKLRLRAYGLPDYKSMVFLELKKKIGGIVNKRRAVLTLEEAYQFLESGMRPAEMDYMNTQVLNEIAYYLTSYQVRPACYISFDRIAFFDKQNSDFRITLDHNLTARREELHLEKGCFGEDLLEAGKYIMEVKLTEAFPLWLSSLLSANGIFRTNFSKYGQAYKQSVHEQKKLNKVM